MNGTRVTTTISSRSFYSKVLKTHRSQHISYDPEAGLLARRATSNGPLGSSNSRSRQRENDPPIVEPVPQGHRKCALGPRTHNCPMPAEGGFRSKKMLVRSSVLHRGRGEGKRKGYTPFQIISHLRSHSWNRSARFQVLHQDFHGGMFCRIPLWKHVHPTARSRSVDNRMIWVSCVSRAAWPFAHLSGHAPFSSSKLKAGMPG